MKRESMTSPIREEKNRLRREFLLRRTQVNPATAASAAAAIKQKVFDQAILSPDQTVGLYWSMGGEVPTLALAQALRDAGCRLCLPRTPSGGGSMEFAEVGDFDSLVKAGWGGLEPAAHQSLIPLKKIHLLIVPGVAFDERGFRLGRGQGYYDRLLSGFSGRKVGIAFDWQVLPVVPTESFDQPVDDVVTERRWISLGRF